MGLSEKRVQTAPFACAELESFILKISSYLQIVWVTWWICGTQCIRKSYGPTRVSVRCLTQPVILNLPQVSNLRPEAELPQSTYIQQPLTIVGRTTITIPRALVRVP